MSISSETLRQFEASIAEISPKVSQISAATDLKYKVYRLAGDLAGITFCDPILLHLSLFKAVLTPAT